MKKEIEIKKYGRLQIIKEVEPIKKIYKIDGSKRIKTRNKRVFLCKCDCGSIREYKIEYLTRGTIKSCGCTRLQSIRDKCSTHGMGKTRIYKIWSGLVTRTTNKNRGETTKRYIERGIKNEFKSFEHFYETMGPTYKEGLTIDRKDNDGNYSPENCRWATRLDQVKNRSNSRYVFYRGHNIYMKDLCDSLGLNLNKVKDRLNKLKWDIDKAFDYKEIPQSLLDSGVSIKQLNINKNS